MATTQMADWKKPSAQARPLRPRMTNRTRSVSSDMSVTRRAKMTKGIKPRPEGEKQIEHLRASAFRALFGSGRAGQVHLVDVLLDHAPHAEARRQTCGSIP